MENNETKKIQKVVNGPVKVKKNPLGAFISTDGASVKNFLVNDVLIPTAKKTICDTIVSVARLIFYGDTKPREGSGGTRVDRVSWVDYSGVSSKKSYDEPRMKPRFDYNNFIFRTRADAEAVLDKLRDIIGVYGFASIAELYDLCEMTQPYTANNYGWDNLRDAEVIIIGDGYSIRFPVAKPRR